MYKTIGAFDHLEREVRVLRQLLRELALALRASPGAAWALGHRGEGQGDFGFKADCEGYGARCAIAQHYRLIRRGPGQSPNKLTRMSGFVVVRDPRVLQLIEDINTQKLERIKVWVGQAVPRRKRGACLAGTSLAWLHLLQTYRPIPILRDVEYLRFGWSTRSRRIRHFRLADLLARYPALKTSEDPVERAIADGEYGPWLAQPYDMPALPIANASVLHTDPNSGQSARVSRRLSATTPFVVDATPGDFRPLTEAPPERAGERTTRSDAQLGPPLLARLNLHAYLGTPRSVRAQAQRFWGDAE